MKSYKIRTQDFSPAMRDAIKAVRENAHKDTWLFINHSRNKAMERGLSQNEVLTAIHTGTVIEYQFINNQERVLLRDNAGVCVSIDLNTKQIITVYKNDADDNHATLDQSQYVSGWQLDLVKNHYQLMQDEKVRTGTYPAGLMDGREIRRRIKE